MKSYDVISIGSGHACWHGALILKAFGKKVALVEKDLLGGTCTNTEETLTQYPLEYTKLIVEKMKSQGAKFIFNFNQHLI
jgi:pyruvate/2-oxoglutarate dehydrogenase complex dihydrolipoamide dehydrogenase (E3) component